VFLNMRYTGMGISSRIMGRLSFCQFKNNKMGG